MARTSSAGKALTVAGLIAGVVFLAAHADASSGPPSSGTPTAKTSVSHASQPPHRERAT